MASEAQQNEGLAALSQLYVGGHTVHETLDRVAALAVETLAPAAAFAGVTLLDGDGPATSVVTDPSLFDADRLRFASGPECGELLVIESTAADTRFPEFSRACLDHGIRTALSAPLTVANAPTGALNVYSRTEGVFGRRERRMATAFAAAAATALANAKAYWTARFHVDQLEEAMRSRAAIEQAKGIIMSTIRCSPDEAFALLRKQSQTQNRKLRDVAGEIVATTARRPDAG